MSFKSGVTAGRILKGRLVSLPRSGHYPCTERDTTPAPNGTVPLFRARCIITPRAIRAVSTARYEMLVPSGGYITLRARSICPLARVVPTHSLGWYLPTRPSGIYTLARVVPAHRSCINFLGAISSFSKTQNNVL